MQIMSRMSLIEVHGVFQQQKRSHRYICLCCFPYVAETPKASIKDQDPPLPITPFGIVTYGFAGQPFSRQLYM